MTTTTILSALNRYGRREIVFVENKFPIEPLAVERSDAEIQDEITLKADAETSPETIFITKGGYSIAEEDCDEETETGKMMTRGTRIYFCSEDGWRHTNLIEWEIYINWDG